MQSKFHSLFVLIIVIVSATVGLAAAAKPYKSALDNVPRFIDAVEKAGFSWQEGEFFYFDLIKQVCQGGIHFSAMGNNPWPNAYFFLKIPNPSELEYELPYPFIYQTRQDEAMVLIGQTPPPVWYFGIQTWVQMGLPPSPGSGDTAPGTFGFRCCPSSAIQRSTS